MLSFLWETFQLRPLWGHFHPDKAFFLINLPCLACPHFWRIVFHSQQIQIFAKGQIISKGLFGVLEFSQKTIELRKGLDTVESLSAGAARDQNRNMATVIIIYIFVTFTHSNIDFRKLLMRISGTVHSSLSCYILRHTY